MAWEISMTAEGWRLVWEELTTKWTQEQLIQAIVDDEYESIEHIVGRNLLDCIDWLHHKAELGRLAHDILVNECMELIEEHNTCDNGGHAVWIDREGYHRVTIPDREPDYSLERC